MIDTKVEEDTIIFGRPFMAKSRMKIDVFKGKLTLKGGLGKKKGSLLYEQRQT